MMEVGSQPNEAGRSQSQRIEILEREGRFPELATELLSAVGRAQGDERAALLARLGEVRLRLDDVSRAIVAFSEAMEIDPVQATARRWLEVLLAEPDHALEAADVLESVYMSEFRTVPHSATMLLAVLELKANRTADMDERIASWVQLGAVFDQAAAPPERLREIAVRLLARTAVEWPGGVAKWIDRVGRTSRDTSQRVEAMLSVLSQPVTDALTVSELALAAGDGLETLGRLDDARILYERSLEADPTSPEALSRVDALAESAGENIESRVARYRAALARAGESERSAALRVSLGILEYRLGDYARAAETLKLALAEAPGMFRAHETLISAYEALKDGEAIEQELERGLTVFEGPNRRATLARLGIALATSGRGPEALERCRSLLDEPDIENVTLDLLQRLAEEAVDLDTVLKIHARRMADAADDVSRARALEDLGDFYAQQAKDPKQAALAFRAAAEILEANAHTLDEAERLYEQVLLATPDDAVIAERRLLLCANGSDFTRVPEASRALLDAVPEISQAVDVLLSLETRAIEMGAADEYAIVIDDVVSRFEDDADPAMRRLVGSKARVLASAARFDDAARVFEALIEAYGDEQEVRAYVSLAESSPDLEWRHGKRRWLFEWRAGRAEDPVSALTNWAAVEEQEFGDVPAAIELLERATRKDAARKDAWRELSRLRIGSGDFTGGLATLRRLRDLSDDVEAKAVELAMAELLLERLDQPADALPLVKSVLTAQPYEQRAQRLALALCQNPKTRSIAAELLERTASEPEDQRRVLSALLDTTESAVLEEGPKSTLQPLRRRWFEQLLALEKGEAALSVVERAAREFPTEEPIWQAVEGGAVRAGKAEVAVRAYEGALERMTDRALAEKLGRRLVTFAEEHIGNPRVLVGPLSRLLQVVPEARWAFDRIRLPLTAEQRWDLLFPLYERVIDATGDPQERAALLDQAAIAARDVASDYDRAISYWESYFALRSDDARVDLALERLYERQKKTAQLIEHLTRREPNLEPHDLRASRERVAGLWLELLDGRSALMVVESLPKSSAGSEATLALLERIFELDLPETAGEEARETQQKVAKRTAKLLKQRYANLDRGQDVARVLVRELAGTSDDPERIKLLGQLAELRRTLRDEAGEFETLGELLLLEPGVAQHRARLGELSLSLGTRGRLAELIVAAAERADDRELFPLLFAEAARILLELGERDQAIGLYARILTESGERVAELDAARKLERLLDEARRSAERCAVLERLAELEPDLLGRRAALLETARVALEELSDPLRAATAYRILIEREPEDRVLIDGLIRALRVGERWQEVIDALTRRAHLEPDTARARRDLGEAARIYAERLGEREASVDAWRGVRARFGRDAESFEALSELLAGLGRFLELSVLIEDEAKSSDAPEPLYARLAEVHRSHTRDMPAALAAYVRANDFLPAAELFVGHAELVPDDPSLGLELAARLEANGKIEIAERVLRRQIEHYGPRRSRDGIGVHLALARLLAGSKRGRLALDELELAVARYPESGQILAAIGGLASELGELDRAEQSYRALLLLLGLATEPGEQPISRPEVYLYLSQIASRRGDADRASDHVASAFEAALGSEDEAIALEGALRRFDRGDLLERAVTSRLERARDPAKVASALRDLLDVSGQLGGVDSGLSERAERLAERAVRDLESAGGAQTNAWQALLDVFDRLGQKVRALTVLEALASRAGSDSERTDHELAIAARQLELGREDAAKETLWQIVRRDAAELRALGTLMSLLGDGEALEPLLQVVKTQLSAAEAARAEDRVEVLAGELASVLERTGRFDAALSAFERLAQAPRRRREALTQVVRLHEKLGSPPAEVSTALDALLTVEQGDEAAKLSLRLAEARRQEGDPQAAERALERGFAAAPANLELREALVDALLTRGAYPDAVRVLTRAVELFPQDPDLFLRLAEAHRRSGNPEKALAALDAALGVGASRAAMRRERALVLESTGRADEALAELEAAQLAEGGPADELLSAIERTGVHRESERWALKAADLSAEGGQRNRAREFLAPWIERSGDSVAVLSRVAKLAAFDRDYALAFESFQKLCRLEQGAARRTSVINLARIAEAAGKADEAIREVEAAIAEGLDSPELRRELGKLFGHTGDRSKQARYMLEEARQAKPTAQADLYLKAAELLAQENQNDEALAALAELHKLDPERVEAALLSARLLASEGRTDEARRYLHELLSGEKKRSKSHAKLYQRLAELHLMEDELAEALDPLLHAHQLDKSDPDVALKLGLLAFDLEQTETSAAALRVFVSLKDKAIDTASRTQLSVAYFHLAELELGKGQRTVARRMAARAAEVNPSNRDAERLLSEINAR